MDRQRLDHSQAHLAASVVGLAAAVTALLALNLPFAAEFDDPSKRVGSAPGSGDESWTGWSLARASRLDHHHPLAAAWVVLLIAATVAVLALGWVAFERGSQRYGAAQLAAAGLLLVASIPIGRSLQGNVGDHHLAYTQWGFSLWRVALLLVLVAGVRASLAAPGSTTQSSQREGS